MLGLAPAPELHRIGLHWFNVDRPLSLADLRGRIVVLDFWTPCCVNCLQILPTLRRVEKSFPDSVAVIGVASPKYPAEQNPASIAHAIARHDIRHPVVHDPELLLWHDYGISAWPTLVFIDPRGCILGDLPGEPAADKLICGLGEMVRQRRCGGRGRAGPAPLPLQHSEETLSRFRFPAKIKPAGTAKKQWAIADGGHHQIVLCDDQGHELRRFGNGTPGFLDLAGEAAAFNSPQGLACADDCIYVADTGNHAIRRIDLASGAVRTLAGTGARGSVLCGSTPADRTSLASVWDLEYADGHLFFANAGTHQLGQLDLATGALMPLAGTGTEELADGTAETAHLAQPTGLALDHAGRTLYFVDSESSSVRSLALQGERAVQTLVGAGLFECGRRNGSFGEARLQHCRGLTFCEGRLVVADTYNGALRVIDLGSRQVSELAGEDWPQGDGIRLAGGDPAGVAADGQRRLLVTDTNHHRIIEVLLDQRSVRVWAS